MGSCASDVFRVLFCGEEFNWGYKFTKEALQDDADIVVSESSWLSCLEQALVVSNQDQQGADAACFNH